MRLRIVMTMAILAAPLATALEAVMVADTNLPAGALRRALEPIISRYHGPWISQGWALFAPGVPRANLSVIVRGRYRNGAVTPWYDVSKYFVDVRHGNPFAPDNALSEGLFHSAATISAEGRLTKSDASIVIERICGMILAKYTAPSSAASMEIEIDEIPIGGHLARKIPPRMWALRVRWSPVPRLGDIDSV